MQIGLGHRFNRFGFNSPRLGRFDLLDRKLLRHLRFTSSVF
jgi:hypothetical protein